MTILKTIQEHVDGKKLVVMGHKNPDVDSILSGYIFAKYLREHGVSAEFVIPDKTIEDDTFNIVTKYGLDVSTFMNDVSDDNYLFLLDHHESNIAGKVIGVIDHHPTIKKFNYPIYINKNASSTTKLIYDAINNSSWFTKELMELVVLGIYVDTVSLKSSKTNKDDISWVDNMCVLYDLDKNKLLEEGYCLTDISDMHKASVNGIKHYTYGKYKVSSSYIQIHHISTIDINNILEVLKSRISQNSLNMWVFIIVDLHKNKTYVYKVRDNIMVESFDGIKSRGSFVMPMIEKELLLNNNLK